MVPMSNLIRLLGKLNAVEECRTRFGEKLKRCRDDLGISQEEFAKKCGMSRQAIFQYESHPNEFKKGISLKRIETFLNVFSEKLQRKISPEEFLRDMVDCN